MKLTLLPDLTNKLMQLIEEIEKIEKIDLQLLQNNIKQFNKEEITYVVLREREKMRDELFCSSFFTPPKTELTSQILVLLKENQNICQNSP